MTGNITTNGLIDTVDIATRDGVLTTTTATADAALPKAGGTMTGSTIHNDNIKSIYGTSSDGLEIFHDSSHSYIKDTGSGYLRILASDYLQLMSSTSEQFLNAEANGAVTLYHDNASKLATSANGVTVTGAAVGTMTTDNDGSFALSASNHFKCTPSGNFTLTFTSIVSQSGNILLVNSGGHTVSAHANTKVDAKFLSTISTAGTYLLAYFSDGTNVYMTNSAIYT